MKYKNRSITVAQFNKLIGEFENTYGKKFEPDIALSNNLYTLQSGKISFRALTIQKLIINNLKEFLFFEKLYHLYHSGPGNKLQIRVEDLNAIFDSHCTLFPLTPSIDVFIHNKALTLSPDGAFYFVEFKYCSMPVKAAVHNKAAAILWDKLLSDSCFNDDKERMVFWYCRIILKNDYCDIDHFFSVGGKIIYGDCFTGCTGRC